MFDFRGLNVATVKDEYPIPIADMLVDAASGHEMLSCMDGHTGYNQIFIAKEDVSKNAFRCPGAIGTYEWVVMPFGLNNAGAWYQRAMNIIIHDVIGKLVEVYIDECFCQVCNQRGTLGSFKASIRENEEARPKNESREVWLWCFSH